jgi:hypothetical protein
MWPNNLQTLKLIIKETEVKQKEFHGCPMLQKELREMNESMSLVSIALLILWAIS